MFNLAFNLVPTNSIMCKKNLQAISKADMTEWRHYETQFQKEVFQKARQILTELDTLLRHFEDA